MSLCVFLSQHRKEVLETCRHRVIEELGEAPEIDRDVELFFDEIVRALRRHGGSSVAYSPLPGPSDAAARLGARPQRDGVMPSKVPGIFGALANAIGSVGERYGLSISADEYNVFNACLDSGVATSIEYFWHGENEQRQRYIQERFGFLAHELRSAVGNAALAFKLLRAGDLQLSGRTAAVLSNNLTRMETLVARTLGSVRLESSMSLDLRPVKVATTLRQVQASSIPERAVSVTLEVDESLHVNADEMLLLSALSNIVNNAIKFSCSGGRVAISCWAQDSRVLIEVEDECGGLAEESALLELTRNSGLNPQMGDLGPGLTITRRAVAAMNGELYVENFPGHGCLFGMSFDAARPSRPSSRPPPPSPAL